MNKSISNILSTYGYNQVALPKAGIQPLALLSKQNGHLTQVGALVDQLFQQDGKAVPEIKKDTKVVDISDSVTVLFDAKAGGNLLGSLIQLPNIVGLKADLSLHTNNNIQVHFQQVREDTINLPLLDSFLNLSAPVAEEFRTYRELLYDGDLYVISAILKSRQFQVTITNENGLTGDLDVNATTAGALDTDISRKKDKKVLLEYNGDIDLVFAFKAQRIIYDHKQWWQFWDRGTTGFRIKDVQGVTMRSGDLKTGESNFPTSPLDMGDKLADI